MKPGEKEVNTLLRFLFVFVFLQTPNPLSLAATNGVSVDFPSFSYSDVSVREVLKVQRAQTSHGAWIRFPDRRSMDHRRYLPMAFRL